MPRKPVWRQVVRRIARELKQAGLSYKIVGGASAALHGVEIPVKDIDIETSAEDAYRFEQLFSTEVLEPVTDKQSQRYRSYFGRFEFHGVIVEVMGDLQRREQERWIPTWTCTRTEIDLDGELVNLSWLEEETLAYVRRGRMDRAARCLEKCDPERMLALLRGEQPTNVI
jgi:hypothetical protein